MLIPLLAAAAVAAHPFDLHEEGRDVDFQYSWPREAAAIAPLAARFRREMLAARLSTARDARADRASRDKSDTFNPHSFEQSWSFAGQSRRLASFTGATYAFTGGAHPNHGSQALLWDKVSRHGVKLAAIVGLPLSALIGRAFCRKLDAERKHRRGPDPYPVGDAFSKCPSLTEITLVPTDADHDGRFEAIAATADAYVAGPYAEGDYYVTLPVTPALLAALKPGYRASFAAAQRQ